MSPEILAIVMFLIKVIALFALKLPEVQELEEIIEGLLGHKLQEALGDETLIITATKIVLDHLKII